MAGYSGTPLAKKLGLKAGSVLFASDPPANYRKLLAPLPDGVVFAPRMSAKAHIAHLFVTRRADLARQLKSMLGLMPQDGAIWISWPKKSAKVPTDITEDTIREVALPLGLVDIKVCAVDEVWSGLKLVIRKEQRAR